MSGEHEERGPAVTEVNGDVVAGSKNVTINYNGGGGGEGPWQPPEAVGRYLAWLAIDKALVNLRGIGGGGIELPLAAVYVPLRLTRSEGQEIDAGKWKRRARGEGGDFEISAMFGHLSQDPRRSEDRHALILGEPGSGKSTAMRKLELLIRDQARCAKGERLPAREGVDEALCADTLAREYVPVRVPLRDFTRADLEVSLRDFVDREVKKRSKGQIDEATIAALWAHGKVVLILDGLDEIAEVAARDGFCSKLNNFAASRDHGSVRIVVTSRIGGYRELSVRPDNRFALVRLQPLSAEQAKRLIGQWFHALVGEVENFSDGDADARTDELSRAIEDGRFSDLRRSMYATPLIATLLCVLNYRSCRMPESRVEFYDTCLRMLLETWPESKQDGAEAGRRAERPLTTTKAIEILATLAHELHAGPTGEQLHRDVILARLGALLGAAKAKKREVFAWLHKDAAIFEELAPCEFGFFHLGVQEYLAALHVAMCGEHAIRGLAVRLGEARWSEVLLMTGALPLRGAFAPLMHELLGRFDPNDKDDEDFLRLAVREGAFEITPFVAHLADASISGAKAQKVLSFVEQRREVELTEPAGRLAERARAMAAPLPEGSVERAVWAAVEARAMQLVAAIKRDERSEAEGEYDVAVVGLDEALQARQALLHHLRTSQKRALRVWPPDGDGEPLGALDVEAVTSAVEAVLVVLVDQAPWQDPGSRAAAQLCLLAQERPLTLVLARGATVSLDKAPEYVLERAPIEQRAGGNVEAIVERLRPGARAEESGGPVVGRLVRVVKQVCIEPKTRMRFLYVPDDVFTMGSEALDNDSKPAHLVRVPEFWIGQTVVTNRVYRLFVEAKKWREPRAWRERRLNDPDQPVVTVSWEDAAAFCAWMSEWTGWAADLPSEAQWEYAARGTDGRLYPWGWEKPDATRACFAQGQEGRPAVVGSHPAGAGPFGALDQAGNVWEWCKDVWNKAAYKSRARTPAINDVEVMTGQKRDWRSLRGGSWRDDDRGALAAAYRLGRWHDRCDLDSSGFRVVVAREPA